MKGFNTGIVYCIGKKKCGERYENGRLGCGGLIVIILLVFAFLNDIASDVGESFQIFFWIGVIIVICVVVKFFHDN